MYQVTYSKLVSKRIFWKVRKWSITWNKLARSRHTYIHSRSHSCGPCGQRHGSKALAWNSARAKQKFHFLVVRFWGCQENQKALFCRYTSGLGPSQSSRWRWPKNDRSSGDKNDVKRVEAVRMRSVLSADLLLFVSGLITCKIFYPVSGNSGIKSVYWFLLR